MILWLAFWMLPVLFLLAAWLALPLFRIPRTASNGPRGVRGTIHWYDLPWLKPPEKPIPAPANARLLGTGPGGVQWWSSFDPYETPFTTFTTATGTTAAPNIVPGAISPGRAKRASSRQEPYRPDLEDGRATLS